MSEAVAERQLAIPRTSGRIRQPRRGVASAFREASLRFYVCLGVLLVAAASMQSVARVLGGYFRKAPVPLKRPLDALRQDKLLPYRLHRSQPKPLDEEELENLGTREYLQWNLTDPLRDPGDPVSRALLFITYNTGQPDLVPHNPKECQAAAGLTLRKETPIEVAVPGRDGADVIIPVSVLEFELPERDRLLLFRGGGGGTPRRAVAYFFYTNGRYVVSRTGVRRAVANLWDRHAYYSKIEVTFADDSGRVLANRAQTIEATRRLLRKVMPILWDDHYQDWEALKQGAPPVILDHQG